MDPGLVGVEIRREIRGDVSEQVHDLRAAGRVEVGQRFCLRVPELTGHRTHRVMGPSVDCVVAERGPRRPVRGCGKRVPSGVRGWIDERGVVFCALVGRVDCVVVLVGILRPGPELLVLLPERRVHPADHVARDAVVPGGRERTVRLRVDRKELGVVFKHLLVMRDLPLARRRVAEEAALDVVVHSATRHRPEGSVQHRCDLGVAEPAMLVEKEAQKPGLRKFRLAPEAAELWVVLPTDQRTDLIDDLKAEIAGLR